MSKEEIDREREYAEMEDWHNYLQHQQQQKDTQDEHPRRRVIYEQDME